MKTTENQYIKEFELLFYTQIQNLTELRTQKFTQQKMSRIAGVSLRTIQNFEAYKSKNLYLFWLYKKLLYGKSN